MSLCYIYATQTKLSFPLRSIFTLSHLNPMASDFVDYADFERQEITHKHVG